MKRFTIGGLALLLVLSFVACDQAATSQDTRDIVIIAVTKTSEVQSYRATVTTTDYADGKSFSSSVESEVAAPDRYIVKSTIGAGWAELIKIGEEKYVRDAESPQWKSCPTGTCSVFYIPIETTLLPFRFLVDIQVLPDDDIDGINCSRYRGRVDVASLVNELKSKTGGMTPPLETPPLEPMLQWEIDVELWIDGDDFIRRLKTELRMPYTDVSTGNERWSVRRADGRFSDFNEADFIEAPEIE